MDSIIGSGDGDGEWKKVKEHWEKDYYCTIFGKQYHLIRKRRHGKNLYHELFWFEKIWWWIKKIFKLDFDHYERKYK